MKILFIVTQSEFGGAQRFLAHLVTVLNKNKYALAVAAGREGDDETGFLKFLEKKGIKTSRLKYLRRGINPLFDFWLGPKEMSKLIKREKPDVLFLCSSKAGLIGSLAGRLAGVKKIIYRIGGWTFNDPWPRWKKKLYILIEKWSARFKDIIVNNAESDRKQAISLGIKPKDKIVVIYNGIDVGRLKFLSREEVREKLLDKFTDYGLRITDYTIGTIADFYPTKGLGYLVETARILRDKNIKFVVIGGGQEQEKKKIKNLIKKYKLENSFFLVEPTFKDHRYIKAFDIFVLPSVKEGFPWTILEAMAAGVPIAATRVGAIPEILEGSGLGQAGLLVEPGNPEELAKAIEKLLKDKELQEKFIKNAKRVVIEKFSLEKMVGEIEKLL